MARFAAAHDALTCPRPPCGATPKGDTAMRWVHLAIIVAFAAVIVIFAFQNFQIVTMSFLGFSARLPLALLAALVYLLGMATGGSLISLLRKSFVASRKPAGAP